MEKRENSTFTVVVNWARTPPLARAEEPCPTAGSRSSTTTRSTPASSSSLATARPMTPPPTTATSTRSAMPLPPLTPTVRSDQVTGAQPQPVQDQGEGSAMATRTNAQPRSPLDDWFRISERGSTVEREVRGGLATFFTMAYIIVLNPLILGGAKDVTGARLDLGQLTTSTALVAAVMTPLFGFWGRPPLVLGPRVRPYAL